MSLVAIDDNKVSSEESNWEFPNVFWKREKSIHAEECVLVKNDYVVYRKWIERYNELWKLK